ncbi:hypothetical protein GX48_01814 [Paracoccidioides brasiliensis]|nr:hypothetical protein GX48_01814 [Paracoccidioides brasiliensis]
MSHPRYRQPSPDNRNFVDPMRASTGNVILGSDMEPYNLPRVDYDGYYSSSVAGDRNLEPYYKNYYYPKRSSHPPEDLITSHASRLTDQPSITRTEYTIRPKSNTLSITDSNLRPLKVPIPSSPNRLFAGYEGGRPSRPSSYYAKNETERYILPSSSLPSRYRRIFSSDDREGRLVLDDKEIPPRSEKGGNLITGRNSQHVYPIPPPLNKSQDIDIGDSYSYTNPAEQFYRDFEATQSYRRDNPARRKARPLSLTGLERYLPQIPRDPRDSGPPPSARGFDRIGRGETRRSSSRDNKGRVTSYSPDIRQGRSRAPVSLHQDGDKTPKQHEEYDALKEYPSNRRSYADDASIKDGLHQKARDDARYGHIPKIDTNVRSTRDISMPGGLATAGLASGYSDEYRSRGYESDRSASLDGRKTRDLGRVASARQRSKEHSERKTDDELSEIETRSLRYRTKGHPGRAYMEESVERRHTYHIKGYESKSSDSRRHNVSSKRHSDKLLTNNHLVSTPADITDQRKPYHTELARPKEPEVPPKSILKPPREKFPEDRTAVREGVAPLKDATKKGIPQGARWTKVDRKLVSPAALQGERYEERPDYVIILRVLTKEEIENFARNTADIRARYESYRRDHRKRRDDDEPDEEDRKSRLALEPPPDVRRRSPPGSHSSDSHKTRASRS